MEDGDRGHETNISGVYWCRKAPRDVRAWAIAANPARGPNEATPARHQTAMSPARLRPKEVSN